jgi:hypothetical protein
LKWSSESCLGFLPFFFSGVGSGPTNGTSGSEKSPGALSTVKYAAAAAPPSSRSTAATAARNALGRRRGFSTNAE